MHFQIRLQNSLWMLLAKHCSKSYTENLKGKLLAKQMASWSGGGCAIQEPRYKANFNNTLMSFWCWCLTFDVEAWKIWCWNDWAQWRHWFYYWPLLRSNNMATNLQRFTSSWGSSVLPHVNVERRHLGRYMQRVTADDSICHILLCYVKRNISADKAHILQPMFSLKCATAHYHQTIVAVKSHSCALATFQNIGKTWKQREPIWIRCVRCLYFDKILYLF